MQHDANTGEAARAEWLSLLECARPTPDILRLSGLLHKLRDWRCFYELASEHGLLGLVTRCLLEHCQSEIPVETSDALRSWRRSHALFTLNLAAEMFRLFDRFRGLGIEAAVIKGPVLSLRCFGDPGLRQYGDLDLIVRDKDISRVTELMIDLGYEAAVPPAAIQARKIPGEYNFRLKSSQLLVEFHTERTFRYHPRRLALDNLFQRHTAAEFDGRRIPALSLEDELVLICIHGAKHFWERLGYIADVAAFFARQELDWQKVESAAAEVGAERMLSVGLRLAQDVLGVELPERVRAATQSDPVAPKLAAQIVRWLPAAGSAPPGIFQRAMFRVSMHGRALAGLGYLLRLSFSPTEQDWAVGNPEKRSRFLDALGRPFRLVRKYGNSSKS